MVFRYLAKSIELGSLLTEPLSRLFSFGRAFALTEAIPIPVTNFVGFAVLTYCKQVISITRWNEYVLVAIPTAAATGPLLYGSVAPPSVQTGLAALFVAGYPPQFVSGITARYESAR